MRRALDELPIRNDEGDTLAVVEVAAGSRNKYKYDHDRGVLELHKVLPLGLSFPYCFGFIPSTRGEDGDPIDVLLFMDEPALPGTVVPCKVIGVIEAQQDGGRGVVRNDRLLGVASSSRQYAHWHAMTDVPRDVLEGIERFFVLYRGEEGVRFEPFARKGQRAAARAIEKGARAFRAAKK